MDENKDLTVETEDESLGEEVLSAFDEGWGDASTDDDDFDLTDTEAEADGPENQREESDDEEATSEQDDTDEPESSEEPEEAEPQPEQKQSFVLKHNGEETAVDSEQVVALAQKGLDYDRIRQERDSFKERYPKLAEYESFLKTLAEASGTDVPGLIERTKAQLLVQKAKDEGKELSEAAAVEQIRRESRQAQAEAAKEAKPADKPEKQAEQSDADKQRSAGIAAFMKAYPSVKPTDIPKEVWDDCFDSGGDLAGAYARWENKKLKEQIETLKQNQKNKERSTGSRRSAGAPTPKDGFDEGWDSI